jgi:hypothetical protein
MPRQTRGPQNHSTTIAAKLLGDLANIDRPADYCTHGQCPSVLPGLHVKNFGEVGLPLSATEAIRLIKNCRQAPYGKGTETIVDTTVRNVWELDPVNFSLKNPKWEAVIESILREIEARLGLPEKSLVAHVYKLLVYEKGSFFLPHRDGEKLERMVATLVINLPAKHSGGELVILHQGQQKVIEMAGAAAGLEAEYAAFYADCQHEVKPLLSGYRLCLTYNLALAKPRGKKTIVAPNFQGTTEQIAGVLSKWALKSGRKVAGPIKLAVMLDHRYSKAGLSIDRLKGVDLAKANVVFDAAERSDCDAHLALVTLWQSGSAEEAYEDYRYGSDRYYSHSDEDDEDGDDEDEDGDDDDESGASSKYTMGEIYEHMLYANHWSNREGRQVSFGKVPLDESEIVSEVELTETNPSREDFEGYTGNAGMTLERWYHRAAIVLWPRGHQFRVWCDAGTDGAIAGLEQLVAKLKKTSKGQDEVRGECRKFAEQIIDTWQARQAKSEWDRSEQEMIKRSSLDRSAFWKSLEKLDDTRLALRMIETVMPKDPSLSLPPDILKWLTKQDWPGFSESILTMMSKTSKDSLWRNISGFREMVTSLKPSGDLKKFGKQLSPIVVEALERFDSSKHQTWDAPKFDRKEVVADLIRSLLAVNDDKLLSRFLAWQSIHPRYQLTQVGIPAAVELVATLKKNAKGNRPIRNWIDEIVQVLESRTVEPPREPTDWRRESRNLDCACGDCMRLSAFLSDPTRPEARFPLAKKRRQHLHQVIALHGLDCTHETLRVGSPQVLVCKKTTARYAEACKVYDQDLKNLAAVRKIESALR